MLRAKEKAALARNVTRLVKAHPLSRRDIATHSKVADGSIGNMMYGKGNPTLDSIVKLATYLKTSTIELLSDKEHPPATGVQESLGLYHVEPRLNKVLTLFQQLTTADQEEFLESMESRANKNAQIVRELSDRKSSASAAFKPAVLDKDVARKMNLSSAHPGDD